VVFGVGAGGGGYFTHMRRLLLLGLLLSATGCHRKHWVVPDTPEGRQCKRVCRSLYYSCVAMYPRENQWGPRAACGKESAACIQDCPGAEEVED
jgi:hypothetical protein